MVHETPGTDGPSSFRRKRPSNSKAGHLGFAAFDDLDSVIGHQLTFSFGEEPIIAIGPVTYASYAA
jgi:hypothetical protein